MDQGEPLINRETIERMQELLDPAYHDDYMRRYAGLMMSEPYLAAYFKARLAETLRKLGPVLPEMSEYEERVTRDIMAVALEPLLAEAFWLGRGDEGVSEFERQRILHYLRRQLRDN